MDYFRDALNRGEYYTETKTLGQEVVGRWGGEAAAKLGLAGEVTKDAIDALCDNLSPVTGERLAVRTRSDRRVGYGVKFHVPTSVLRRRADPRRPPRGSGRDHGRARVPGPDAHPRAGSDCGQDGPRCPHDPGIVNDVSE
jgi:hypothetical protein